MKPNFKVSDFFSRGDFAILGPERPDAPFSKYETPMVGFVSFSYKTQWGEAHDAHLGAACLVDRVDDHNGCLLLIRRDNPIHGIWVCFDWVTKSSKEEAKRINSQRRAKVESDRQINGADRRRDMNLMMVFRGHIPESKWAPGDIVEITLEGHVQEGKLAKLVRKDLDGWMLDFPNLGQGGGWKPENLKWVKC